MSQPPDANQNSSSRSALRPWLGHLWALLVLLGSLALVFALWRLAYERELRSAEQEFVSRTAEISAVLKQQMVQYELVARGGASLFASVARPTPRQWYGYVSGMDIGNRFEAMVGLGFAGYVRQSRLGDLQLEWRQAGWGLLQVRPHGMRTHYGPILYLEPRTPANVEAVGYDMYSNPVRRAAMQRSLDTGLPSLSGPVHLVQDADPTASGLLLYLPVYRSGDRPATLPARQESMLGWVYVPFRAQEFVTSAMAGADPGTHLRIRDVTGGGDRLIFNSEGADSQAAFRHDITLDQYGRRWKVEFESPPLAVAAPRLATLQNTVALGLFASLLMYAIAWTLARTESRAYSIAVKLTEDFRRSEMRFRTAMEHSAIGKALLDSQGRIVEANVALGLILDRKPETLVGARFDSLFQDDGSALDVMPAGSTDAHGVLRSTRRLHREGGEPRHAQLTYAPLPGNVGQDIVKLVQVEDVTERVKAEAQVRALNRTLEARVASRTRELSLANQELEAFAYSISHDLRAPLRAIDGFSRILVERYADALDDAGRGYLERIHRAAGRMDDLIQALLRMSRVSRGAMKREHVDLSRVAADVVDELRAGDSTHVVAVAIAPDMGAEGDAILLRNLLGNLIGNAWKFTRGRENARIEVGREARAGTQEYFVRDNGAGFPQEYVDKLFRPFQRLHAQNEFAGHGIGLASVKRVVERHGGTIRAEGRQGEGATFYFTLGDDPVIR